MFSHRLEVLEIFSFTFHFPVLFFCTDHYTHTSRNSDGHQSLFHLIGACFSEEITLLYALLWDLEFSRNWGKKWVPTNTTVVTYFTTTAQPFLIFRKLLAIAHSHRYIIVLNQKINTNTKSPMLLTQLVLQYQIKYNKH